MADVNKPRTWPARCQMEFWAFRGRATPLRGTVVAPKWGSSVKWLDEEARAYWGQIVGDPAFAQAEPYPAAGDEPPYDGPGPGDGPIFGGRPPVPGGGQRFCPMCGRPGAAGASFCGYDGTHL